LAGHKKTLSGPLFAHPYPKRFKEGRAAILQALNINHQKDILGIKFNNPWLINNEV
jgi:hypothetical protein